MLLFKLAISIKNKEEQNAWTIRTLWFSNL